MIREPEDDCSVCKKQRYDAQVLTERGSAFLLHNGEWHKLPDLAQCLEHRDGTMQILPNGKVIVVGGTNMKNIKSKKCMVCWQLQLFEHLCWPPNRRWRASCQLLDLNAVDKIFNDPKFSNHCAEEEE
eukprot:SAG31_NODE_4276_length_3386_cov_1.703681_2_plen_128_part_00